MGEFMTENTIAAETLRVTAPLSMDQIKAFFENKNLRFLIDYKGSQIQGQKLLVYVSNLELPCDLDLSGSSQEEILQLLHAYMDAKCLVDCDVLRALSGLIMLESNSIDSSFLFDVSPLERGAIQRFLTENSEGVARWNSFIASSFVSFLAGVEAIEEQYRFKSQLETIDDRDYVGHNIVGLFSLPGFVEAFHSAPITHPIKYYKPQFEDYMFKGKSFHHYFCNDNNLLAIYLDGVLSGAIPPDEAAKA
jgi:hypothetical protein